MLITKSVRRVAKAIALLAAILFGAAATPALAGVSAEFTTGAIAEYSGPNANQNDNSVDFASLGISKIVMSQNGSQWGGTQGNDTSVTLTIYYAAGGTYSFTGALNWQLNDGGSAIPVQYFGVTTATPVDDALDLYSRTSPSLSKTYILVLPSKVSSSNFASLVTTDQTDGSANFNEAAIFQALTSEFPPADPAPVITGPTGGAGATASAVSVYENQTGATTLTANETVTWSITGGQDGAKFTINPTTGVLTFVAAPDYEVPTDGSTSGSNTYIVQVQALDLGGNVSTQTVTVTVLNLDDTPPAITGPGGVAGATTSALSVNENQTGVTTLTSNEPVTWSITGGQDGVKFAIDPNTGVLTFVAAPDYENPTDGSTSGSNTYIVQVQALDAAGNISTQTITVTVLNLDDTPATITGPGGVAGATTSALSVNENQTGVTTLTSNEPVTWSIAGGQDGAKFAIDPNTGVMTFVAAPDYEVPTDGSTSGSNTYIVQVQALDAAGNISLQTVTVTVLNVDDTPATITGPGGVAGATTSALSVNENQTGVTTLTSNEPVTWSITGGQDGAKFAVDPSTGVLTFVTAPDYENPTDGSTSGSNTYIVQVQALDAAGNISTQTITVTVLNLDDTPPVITGPSGGAGAAASAVSVYENQTGATTLTANETVTWSITGGQDGAKFTINQNTGVLTFVAAPDYELPTDGVTSGSNTYIVQVQARDTAGNVSTQTVTVTVLDLDDTAPLITGPSGGAGAAASAITINEGLTAVTTFTANETVTWSIDGGSDAGKFTINPTTGAIVFQAAPDYENPTDSDHNNTYVVRIKAVDASGNISYQTLTVTIANVDEIGRKLAQIGDRLRTGLRTYAVHGLSDMLSFNESMMSGGGKDDGCNDPKARKELSGSVRANQAGGNVNLNYAKRLSECGRRDQVLANVGMTYSKLGGNWNSRLFASLRYETRIDKDLTVGIGAIASRANDTITGFDNSTISDKSVQLNLYGRYRLSEKLRTGAFFGLGRAWYDFGLNESDGFVLNGKMTGDRQVYGWMLSGDYAIGNTVLTTDAIVSRAVEKLGSASLAAQYLGENRSGIAFAVGTVDVTRISVPVTAPITLSGSEGDLGSWSRLLLSPGLLCEDNDVDSSALRCGYQLGAKLAANDNSGRNRFYADYHWESVAGMKRSLIGLGYAYRFGKDTGFELAFDVNRGLNGGSRQDNRAMVSLRLAK